MLYPYICRECESRFEVVKPLCDIDEPEKCPECDSDNTFRSIGLVRIGSVDRESYQPAFGKVIKNKLHLKDELLRARDEGREMVAVGDEPVDKLASNLERTRTERWRKSWSEPVEKAMQEVLG